ncbi:MAG: phosphoribosyltransferase family protein [Pseudomonadota bacterium]
MADKHYISAQSLLEDAFRLGSAVVQSGFKPSFILALWRGAAPIGIAVQEFLAWHDIDTDHIAVRTSSYTGIDQQSREIAIYGMNYLIKNVTHDDRLLIVDDVFDTGHTIDALISQLRALTRRNAPADIRVAVPYYKPTRNETQRVPDYYLHETEQWLKFPHSLEGLSDAEIREHRPQLHQILANAVSRARKA